MDRCPVRQASLSQPKKEIFKPKQTFVVHWKESDKNELVAKL